MTGSDETVITKLLSGPVPASTADRSGSALPLSLMRQASRRLQAVSLILLVLLVISWLVINLVEGQLDDEFASPAQWGPPVAMILASIAVLVITRGALLTASAIMTIGLV